MNRSFHIYGLIPTYTKFTPNFARDNAILTVHSHILLIGVRVAGPTRTSLGSSLA